LQPINVAIAARVENFRSALGKPIIIIAQHDAGRAARHQAREIQLQPAQRNRSRPQQMALREDQLLADVNERELAAVAEHGLESVGIDRAHDLDARREAGHDGMWAGYVACCGVIWCTSPVLRSIRMRVILSRLVPVTRTKRA